MSKANGFSRQDLIEDLNEVKVKVEDILQTLEKKQDLDETQKSFVLSLNL